MQWYPLLPKLTGSRNFTWTGRQFSLDLQANVALCTQQGRKGWGRVIHNPDKFATMPVGIVLRRSPGVTRWAQWSWKAVSVLPGCGDARWRVLREENGATEFHAATLPLELHGSDTEAYLHGLAAQVPCIYVVLRASEDDTHPLEVTLVTASPYEAQDYADSGEEIVEKVAMPPGLIAWVRDFAEYHHQHEAFKKRRRDKKDIGAVEDGVGDVRIVQVTDVYRAPASARKVRLQ
jgi:uncharacterized protein DUF3305